VTSAEALAAIRGWYRLDRAFAEVNRVWQETHQVTGAQVAILRIVAERATWPLSELRDRLSMHPATLGQLVARLAERSLVVVEAEPGDRRRRQVALAPDGRALLDELPVVGPVRLRSVEVDVEQLRRLAEAFDLAVELFGLTPFVPEPSGSPVHFESKDAPA
jgi:MarR family transcriptional regulator, temperature-dependent positive regulator of motility